MGQAWPELLGGNLRTGTQVVDGAVGLGSGNPGSRGATIPHRMGDNGHLVPRLEGLQFDSHAQQRGRAFGLEALIYGLFLGRGHARQAAYASTLANGVSLSLGFGLRALGWV